MDAVKLRNRQTHTFLLENTGEFKTRFLRWANRYKNCCILETNSHHFTQVSGNIQFDHDWLAGVGAVAELIVEKGRGFDLLKFFFQSHQDWLFGFLTYDLKNEIEQLKSENDDEVAMPVLQFFQPRYLFKIEANELYLSFLPSMDNEKTVTAVFEEINSTEADLSFKASKPKIYSRIGEEEYLENVQHLKQHIQLGDIYEVNYCFEHYAENAEINPVEVYRRLNEISPAPFSCFYRKDSHYLMSASPERFLKKQGNKLTSQPMKGTVRRSADKSEDEQLRLQLFQDPKERAENVMIVDLVRNDLARAAKKGSVKVDELYGIYEFPQVHQMISTVSAELDENCHFVDAIKSAFPMGSMTGAPKVRAMELIEKYETTKRGLYSGAVGYITPDGDFDFNVVIRSMLYNAEKKYLSMMTGSAITANSDPQKEYEECLLKAKAMLQTLQSS